MKTVVNNIELCCDSVKAWMRKNRLKLNDDKTEVILIDPKEKRKSIELKSIRIGDSNIEIVESVRNLGLYLDADLSMSSHVSHVVKCCYFHIRRLGKIRNLLTKEVANAIAVSTVTSRLDYCNSTLQGISSEELDRLQKTQNSAARIVAKSKLRDHITPVLIKLHWLPIRLRIQYKILCFTYLCLNSLAPAYLSELIPEYKPTKSLRSEDQFRICLPSVDNTNKIRLGGRSFQNSAPQLWNSLPLSLKKADNIAVFRRKLKTYLFSQI